MSLQRFKEISQNNNHEPKKPISTAHAGLQSLNHHHTVPVLKMDVSFKFTENYFYLLIKENSFKAIETVCFCFQTVFKK